MPSEFLDSLLKSHDVGEEESPFLRSLVRKEVVEPLVPDVRPSEAKPKDMDTIYGTRAAIAPPISFPGAGWSPAYSAELGISGMFPQPPGGWDELNRPLNEEGIPYSEAVPEQGPEYSDVVRAELDEVRENVRMEAIPEISQGKEPSFIKSLWHKITKPTSASRARDVLNIVIADELGVRPSDVDPTYGTAISGGFGGSVSGLIRTAETDQEFAKIVEEALPHMPLAKRLAFQAASVAGDLPFMAVGALAGAPAGPVGAMGGMFGLPAGLRSLYMHKIDKGEIDTFGEFWESLSNAAIATSKGYLTGVLTAGAGKLGAMTKLPASKLTGEVTAMTAVGAALDGHVPGSQDFIDAALIIGGMRLAGKAPSIVSKMKHIYKLTGRHPKDIVNDIKTNLELKRSLVSDEKGVSKEVIDSVNKEIKKVEELNLRAEAEKKDFGNMVGEDLGAIHSRIKEVKRLPIKKLVDEQIDKAMREKVKEPKVEEPVTEVDLQTGTPEPAGLSPKDSPLNTNLKKTKGLARILGKETSEKIASDPDLGLMKVINDVNRWRHGEDVDIEASRNTLSRLATELPPEWKRQLGLADDPMASLSNFQETVSEAAVWARRADRLKIEPSIDLNVAIPLNQVPDLVRSMFKEVRNVRFDRLYRNKEVFDKTGFWLGRDGKWRYELDDKEANYNTATISNSESYSKGGIWTGYLDAVLDYPELYRAFPGIRDILISVDKKLESRGIYFPDDKIIKTRTPDKSVLLHELQHAVNDLAGSKFVGTSPGIEAAAGGKYGSMSRYLKDPGEMEARLAERRMKMSAKDRKAEAPWETLDSMLEREVVTKGKGLKLYSGISPEEILKGAKRYREAFNKYFEVKKFKPTKAYKAVKESGIRALIERKGNLRRMLLELGDLDDVGYDIVQKMYLASGAPGHSKVLFKQMHKEVFGGLSKSYKHILFALINSERLGDVVGYKPKYKLPDGMTSNDIISYKGAFEKAEGISPEKAIDLRARALGYFEWIKHIVDDMQKSGLVSEKGAVDLKAHKWEKLRAVQELDYKYSVKIGDRTYSVRESGVEKLGKGRTGRIIEGDAALLALEFFNRQYGRIYNNETMKAWVDLAMKNPKNGLAVVKGKDVKVPKNYSRFFYWEKGERKAIHLHPSVAKEMVTSASKEFTYRFAKSTGILMAGPLRFMATGAAPLWSTFVNFPIDLLTAWGAARVFRDGKWENLYSHHLPVYALQMGADLARTAHDAHFRGSRYELMAENGGLLSFLATQARFGVPGKKLPTVFSRIGDFMTYHSESMELWTRMAIQERVIRRTAKEQGISYEKALKDKSITQEAAFAARDYIDFNQGGWLIKSIDQILPYTNAGAQAGRTFWRQAKDDPAGFWYRMSQVGAVATGVTAAGWMFNSEVQSGISLRVRAMNRTFPLPESLGFIDEDNAFRGLYLKVPLPSGIAFFNSLFETLTESALYRAGIIKYEPDYEAVFESMKAQLPTDPSFLPPLVRSFNTYKSGHDFFRDRLVVDKRLPYPLSKHETDSDVPQALEDIGKVTGLSPKRLGPALRAVLTESIWSHAVGEGYEKAFGDTPEDVRRDDFFITLSKIPKVSRIIGVTIPDARLRGKVSEIVAEQEAKDMIRKNAVEGYAKNAFWRDSKIAEDELDEYLDGVKDESVDDYVSLMNKKLFIQNISDLPNRRTWLSIYNKKPETRAKIFVEKYRVADGVRKEELWDELAVLSSVGGFDSDRFRIEVNRLIEE